jgi:tartrate dehydratase beta subunit/fumarate hydratase class I family protein
MEAIYEFTVRDMPVTVAVDSTGESVHRTGRANGRRASADSRRRGVTRRAAPRRRPLV